MKKMKKMKTWISVLLSAMLLCTSLCVAFAEEATVTPQGVNVARGKTVTASDAHEWYPAKGLVDGVYSASGVDAAKWRTNDNTSGADKTYSAVVDLGTACVINAIVIEPFYNANSSNRPVSVYASVDGETYSEALATVSEAGVYTIAVTDQTAYRYVKVECSAWNGVNVGVWELEVYSVASKSGVNVAKGKSVTANSEHTTGYYPASKLTDGKMAVDGDQWCANYPQTTNYDYAVVDMGKPYSINAISVYMRPVYSNSPGLVYVSNDKETWNFLGIVKPATGEQVVPVNPENKWQYVKIQGKQVSGNLFAVYELEAYSVIEPEGENVALEKPATANAVHSMYPINKLTDGDSSTEGCQWCAVYPQGTMAYDYAIVDLKKQYSINAISVFMSPKYSSSQGMVYVSNDKATWTHIGNVEAVYGRQTLLVDTANSWQYVKVQGKQVAGSIFGVFELEVYSTDKFVVQGENVARGKKVTANSEQPEGWYPAQKLVDGNFSTSGYDGGRWTTDYNKTGATFEAYAVIDLGKPYSINALTAEILWNDYSSKKAATFYGSVDNVTYSEALGTISGEGIQTIEVFDQTKYQYIKVVGNVTNGLNWGLWEVQAFSADDYVACETAYVASEADTTVVEKIPESGSFAVKVNYSNTGAARSLKGYLVEYRNDKSMVKATTVDVPVGENEQNGEKLVPVTVDSETESFRFFLWDEDFVPYTSALPIAK